MRTTTAINENIKKEVIKAFAFKYSGEEIDCAKTGTFKEKEGYIKDLSERISYINKLINS